MGRHVIRRSGLDGVAADGWDAWTASLNPINACIVSRCLALPVQLARISQRASV